MKYQSKWKLSFELCNLGTVFLIVPIICLLSLVLLYSTKDIFSAIYIEENLVFTNYYFIIDFIIPIIMMFNVLLLFSEDLKDSNVSFTLSLPVSKFYFIIIRYFRLFFLLMIPYIITLYFCHLKINDMVGKSVNFQSYLQITLPSCLFLMGLGVVSVVITRTLFYSAAICGVFILIDASTMGNFFENKSVFISMYLQNFNTNQVYDNRWMYSVLGFLLPFLSYYIFSTKTYDKLLIK